MRAQITLLMVLAAAGTFTCKAEIASDIDEARFDKRGDLDLPAGSKQWVSYKDFNFLVMPPGNLLLKDPQNRFEPFSEKRQQLRGDDSNKIESDKDLMKRMANRAKEAIKVQEEARKAREKETKELAESDKKAREKQEKIEREAIKKQEEQMERERAAREGYLYGPDGRPVTTRDGYPVRTESGWPVYFNFGVGVFFGNGHRHGRCR